MLKWFHWVGNLSGRVWPEGNLVTRWTGLLPSTGKFYVHAVMEMLLVWQNFRHWLHRGRKLSFLQHTVHQMTTISSNDNIFVSVHDSGCNPSSSSVSLVLFCFCFRQIVVKKMCSDLKHISQPPPITNYHRFLGYIVYDVSGFVVLFGVGKISTEEFRQNLD